MPDSDNRRYTTSEDALQTWADHAHAYQQVTSDDNWQSESDRSATLRQPFHELVAFRQEADVFRDEVLTLIDQHGAHMAKRSCLPDHVTASAAVVRVSDYAMVVMHHIKLDRWLQPGGHADGVVDLRKVALEEAQEETGIDDLTLIDPAIDCDIHDVPYRGPVTTTMNEKSVVRHLDIRFLVLARSDAQLLGNHESTAVQWVTESQLANLTNEPNLLQLCRTAVACAKELA